MATHGASRDLRVCPECGSRAGAEPFCQNCGLNLLAACQRLPTRAEWEASRPAPAPGQTVSRRSGQVPWKALDWIRRHHRLAAGGGGALAAAAVLLFGG